MTHVDKPDELQDVLDAYRAAADAPSLDVLSAWVRRYPHYAQELTDFTAAWSLTDTLPMAPEVRDLPDDDLVRRGMARVEAVLARQQAPATAEYAKYTVPVKSIAAEGQAQGLSNRDVAGRAGLSIVLLRMLDRRLIRFSSIPREAIEALAGAIGRESAAVVQYLHGAPTLAEGASYYSEATPVVAEQQDFFAAVREDPTLDDATRARWLALEPTER